MGFTTVKVRSEDKQALDRLQHEYALRTGEEIAQHELFHRLLEFARSARADFLRTRGKGDPRKVDLRRYYIDLGETDIANDLDEVVYGLRE